VAAVTYLDTHVAAWLYAGRVDLLPAAVRKRLDEDDLFISPAVTLELQYLFEIGRTSQPGAQVVDALTRQIGLQVCQQPLSEVVAAALKLSWTRDPFDRLIVGQAIVRNAGLLTKDRNVRRHFQGAFWKR